ncbi:MAG: tetratricopeptide repeat protein [Ferruginibacter sp.]
MKYLFTIAILFVMHSGFGQSVIEKAYACHDNLDYQCALDNYLIALDKKLYKEGERYLFEYHVGSCYYALKQYTHAEDYFKRSLASKPNDYLSFWKLADVYYSLKKYTDAVTYYKKALDITTIAAEKDEINHWMGNAYYRLKDYTAAISTFKKIQSREKTLYDIDAEIGNSFLNLAKYDSAITYYTIAEKFYKSGDTAVKVVRYNTGKAYRGLGKYEQAMEILDALLKQYPTYASVIWEKGVIYVNKKDYNNAITWYKKALPFYTGDTLNSYTLIGNIAASYQFLNNYAEVANWYFKRKDYAVNKYWDYAKVASLQYGKLKQASAAEKTCAEAINRYQLETEAKKKTAQIDYVKMNSILGKIALEKKDTAKALKYFEEALRLDKTVYEANAGAGEIAWARKKEEDLKKYYKQVYLSTYDTLLSSKKEIANVYGRAAYVDANINKLQPSSYSLNVEKALSFDSAQKEAVLLWPIVLVKGYSYDLNNKRNKCLSNLDKAIKLYATDKEYLSDLYNSKAVVTDQKDTAAIRKALEEAVKIYPDNIRPWDNLLKFYSSYDNAKGAVMVDKLITVLKKKKNNATLADAYVYKGDFLWRSNKKEDARKQYAEALIWDPENKNAKERAKL